MALALHRRWLALAGTMPRSADAGERLIARWSSRIAAITRRSTWPRSWTASTNSAAAPRT